MVRGTLFTVQISHFVKLFFSACSSISIYFARAIRECCTEEHLGKLKNIISSMPRLLDWECHWFLVLSIILQANNRDPLLLGCKERLSANQGSDRSGWLCGVGGSLWLHCQDPLSDSPTKYKNFGAGFYNWPEKLWKLSSQRWQPLLWGRFTRNGNQGRISNFFGECW